MGERVEPNERESLQDSEFIRHRLYAGESSAFARYASLVLARPSLAALLRYELLTTLIGPIPGALGLALRRLLYPFLFPAIGRGVVFGANLTIRHPERIRLGDGVMLDDGVVLDGRGAGEDGLVIEDRVIVNRSATIVTKVGGITIGHDTNVGAGATIISQGPIRIGPEVSIAGDVCIAGGRYVVGRTGDPADDKQRFTSGEIRIGARARLGMRATIQDGVEIGEGAIVAPVSVVVADVPAQTVVSGFPARPWRARKIADASGSARTEPEPAPDPGAASVPDDPATAEQVRGWLEETKFAEFGGEDGLSDSDSLFDHDIIDSVGLVAMVDWLEETFGIDVSDEDVVPENMETVAHIVRFVSERRAAEP